ncbi:hypothetical protein OQA88_1257 [Cercophora sp. LCS_1]
MNVNLNLGDPLDVPNLVQRALPKESRNKNVAIVKDNWTGAMNHNDPNFLSDEFPRNPPKLFITAESDDFDTQTLADWQAEGFNVEYLPMGPGGDAYRRGLQTLHRRANLGPCETFGIIAYGEAASLCLEHYHVLDNNPELKLGCLIAYYPTRIPDPGTRFPSAIRVLVHLTVGEIGVVKQTQMVGIQGKKRIVKSNVDSGIGIGGTQMTGYPSCSYEADAGFAEHDLDEYDRICAEVAWSRSLTTARKAFGINVNVEKVVEINAQARLRTRNLQDTMATYTTQTAPEVTAVPTLSGAIGSQKLEQFYDWYFIQDNPPSMQITLLSRTVGVDRVVDEMFLSFKHTQEIPWMLPGVPATNKRVEIIIVSIVTLKAGKLCHERMYWDQASVLAQVGLLDPGLVPDKARERGVERLPVVGRKAARRVFSGGSEDEDGEADNELIKASEDASEEEAEEKDEVEDGKEKKAGDQGADEHEENGTPAEPKLSAAGEEGAKGR